MKMLSLQQLLENYQHAQTLLAKAVARSYPVGQAVWVKRGRGEMFARVAYAPAEWVPTRVAVLSAKGRKIHWVDYRDCRKVGT